MFVVANVTAGWTTNPSEQAYYFIEHDENGNPLADGSIWLNGSFNDTTFYVYYNGDSYNSDYDNGDKVFEFFDDFDGDNLNTTKWTCVDNTCAVSNSIGSQAAPSTSGTYGMRTNSVYDKNDNFHFYCKIQEANYGFFGTAIRDVGGAGRFDMKEYVYNSADGGWITLTYDSTGSNKFQNKVSATGYADYFKAEMRQYGTSYVEFYHNDSLINNHTAKIPLTDGYIFIFGLNGKYVDCDWIFNSLRNTYSTSYGSEESGSWTIDGITYTKRKEVNMTGTFDGQIELDYNQFNSTNVTVTTFSEPGLITIVSPTTTEYLEQNILINITNSTKVDNIWYNWNGTNVTYTTPVTITFPAGEHTLFVWANNTSGDEQEVSVTFEVFTPPTQSNITQPEDKIYGHSVELEWTESTVEYGNIDYYNVIFVGSAANYSVYNGLDLDTTWDVRSIPDQEGYLNMEVCGDFGLCTESQTSLFNITNFNVTINEPSVNATFTNNTYFEFERDGNYNLWCDLYADDVIIRSKSLTSGTNIWNATLNLDGYDDLRVDCNIIGYTSIMSTFNYSINITEVPYILDYEMTLTEYGSVYDASQVLFYDHNGYLNLLFFSVLSSTDYLNVLVLNGSDILYEYQEPLDLTMSYINVFLEPAQTTLLLVNSTGNGIHWVNVTDTSMTIDTEAFEDFIIVDRPDKFEPAQLVNTHGNVGVAGGYFVVGLPSSTTNYKMYRKNVSDNTLTDLSKNVRGYSVSTSLKSSDFLEWYVAGGDSDSTSNLRLDYYNSTAWVNVYSTAVGTEVFTNVNYKTKVRFTENNIFLTQLGSSARPFKILNLTSATGHYTSNIQVYNNTLPIYVTDDIFVMLLNSNAGERYYVCEGQDSITCDVVTPSDYGFTVPFTNYPLSANYINSNGINKVTYGKTFSGYPFTFNYNENVYDAKFQCLDEMEEHNLDFVFTVSTDTTNNQLATKLIGYVIPSSIMPSGRKDFNVLCDTSVYRKYYLGLDTNYLMNFYGLNESDGLYYTIEVIDAFSNPIPGMLLSAKRYSGGELSFVTIEQGVTDTNGHVILFLEPTILYKINVIDLTTNILITEFDLVPGTTTNIQLKVDTSERLNLDDPSQMFDDVVWLLTPKPTTFRNSTEVEYSVSSASSSLEYSGFYITKTNATGSYVVYNNSGTSPTTQTYSYLFNETGKYEMTTYFKHSNYSAFFSHYSYIYAGNSTFILAQESFEDFNISGWAYFLIVLVVVGMVMGYVSHYSWEGASAVGILVMWAMVIFAPSDMTLVSRGVGTPYEFTISLIHVVSILTLLVGVLLFRRYRA